MACDHLLLVAQEDEAVTNAHYDFKGPFSSGSFSNSAWQSLLRTLGVEFRNIETAFDGMPTDANITILNNLAEPVTVANLTAAGTAGAGARGFVTDATSTTFASTVTGGGSNSVPVYSDGTNWKIG